MFLEAVDAKSAFLQCVFEGQRGRIFILGGAFDGQEDKNIAGRPFEETTGTTRERIGTEIHEAGVRSLPGLGLAQPRGVFRFRLAPKGRGVINCNFRLFTWNFLAAAPTRISNDIDVGVEEVKA